MFEVSKAEIIELLASFRNSNEFGRYEKGKVILEDGDVFEIRSNSFGWTVKDVKNNVKAEDIELRVAIDIVLETVETNKKENDAYEDYESGAMYYAEA